MPFKLYGIVAALVIWSGGLWYVSGQVKENSFNQERLANAQAIINIQQENQSLESKIAKTLNEGIDKLSKQSEQNKKDLKNEIASNPRYSDCRITDGVRDNYKRKLQTQ